MTMVGFREVHDLNGIGQLWTMIVTVSGVAIIFGGVGIVAERLSALRRHEQEPRPLLVVVPSWQPPRVRIRPRLNLRHPSPPRRAR